MKQKLTPEIRVQLEEFFENSSFKEWYNQELDLDNLDLLYGKSDYKETLLHYALRKDNKKIFNLLLKLGASPNVKNSWGGIVVNAVSNYQSTLDFLKMLEGYVDFNAPTGSGTPPIFSAKKNPAGVQFLLKAGVDPNTCANNVSVLEDFCSRYQMESRVAESIRVLLLNGADANNDKGSGERPLHIALSNLYSGDNSDYNSIVHDLLTIGKADPNLYDSKGNTALFYCLKYTDESVVINKLLTHGANINLVNDKGENALNFSSNAFSANENVLKLLVDKVEDINHCDNNGQNILHKLTPDISKDLWIFLINKGVNLLAVDNDGKLPLDYVLEGSFERADLLIRLGGGPVIKDTQLLDEIDFLVEGLLKEYSTNSLITLMKQKLKGNFEVNYPKKLMDVYANINPLFKIDTMCQFFENPSELSDIQKQLLYNQAINTSILFLLEADLKAVVSKELVECFDKMSDILPVYKYKNKAWELYKKYFEILQNPTLAKFDLNKLSEESFDDMEELNYDLQLKVLDDISKGDLDSLNKLYTEPSSCLRDLVWTRGLDICALFAIANGNVDYLNNICGYDSYALSSINTIEGWGISATQVAVASGNPQILECIKDKRPECLSQKIYGYKTILDMALAYNNTEMIECVCNIISEKEVKETINFLLKSDDAAIFEKLLENITFEQDELYEIYKTAITKNSFRIALLTLEQISDIKALFNDVVLSENFVAALEVLSNKKEDIGLDYVNELIGASENGSSRCKFLSEVYGVFDVNYDSI